MWVAQCKQVLTNKVQRDGVICECALMLIARCPSGCLLVLAKRAVTLDAERILDSSHSGTGVLKALIRARKTSAPR